MNQLISPTLTVPADEVHVWLTREDTDHPCDSDAFAILGETERERAGRFVFSQDRRRFIASHIFLRRILAGYMGIGTASIEFEYNPQGKPILRPASRLVPLQFTFAHSEELAVVAIGWQPIGIDIEKVTAVEDYTSIARGFFSRREQQAILRLPPELQQRAFHVCWTRREALLKAAGTGLSKLSTLVDVPFDLDVTLNRVQMNGELERPTEWVVADFELGEEAVGALAVPLGTKGIRACSGFDTPGF